MHRCDVRNESAIRLRRLPQAISPSLMHILSYIGIFNLGWGLLTPLRTFSYWVAALLCRTVLFQSYPPCMLPANPFPLQGAVCVASWTRQLLSKVLSGPHVRSATPQPSADSWTRQLPLVTQHLKRLGECRQNIHSLGATICTQTQIPIHARAIEPMFCPWYYFERRFSSQGSTLLPLVWLLPSGLGTIGELGTWQSWTRQALSYVHVVDTAIYTHHRHYVVGVAGCLLLSEFPVCTLEVLGPGAQRGNCVVDCHFGPRANFRQFQLVLDPDRPMITAWLYAESGSLPGAHGPLSRCI